MDETLLDILKRAIGYLALHGYEDEARKLGSEARAALAATQAPIYQGRDKGEQKWLDLSKDAHDHMAKFDLIFETRIVYAAPESSVASKEE